MVGAVEVGQILFGGGVTLAGTIAVQLFVIPHVQARTRGRERWEKDMRDLAALVEEELPRAIHGYRWAGYGVRVYRMVQGDPKYDPVKVETGLAEAVGETREANAALGEKMARLKILIGRVKRLNPDAWYWRQLQLLHMNLQASMWSVPGHEPGAPDLDDDQWEKVWKDAEAARTQLLSKVNGIADRIPMKPPSTHRTRRVRWMIWRNIRASDGRDLLAGP